MKGQKHPASDMVRDGYAARGAGSSTIEMQDLFTYWGLVVGINKGIYYIGIIFASTNRQ